MSSYISKISLFETANKIRSGEYPLEDFINSLCDKIEESDPFIHSLLPEAGRRVRLLASAAELIKKYPDAKQRPALFGIPVGIKDIINVEGFETKAGSKLPSELFKGLEATIVKQLKNAGALILGKTVTTEFAYFEPGPTRNPHNPEHTPGGSSSGSAAAVACGFTPISIGTQTIGSVIRPAAYCGIIGFKPSFGRIPTDGILPFSVSADHVGIFTQDIKGIELAASVICKSWNNELSNHERKPVLGVIEGKYLNQADDEIQALFEEQTEMLVKAGFELKRLKDLDNIEEINQLHKNMISAEFAAVHDKWFYEYHDFYGEETKKLILQGKNVSDKELSEAINDRQIFRNFLKTLMKKNRIDIWVSPASKTTPPVGPNTGSPIMNLPWTFAGLPTITIPGVKSKTNLPVGLQFAGSFNQDERLIGFITKLQDAFQY